LDTGNAQVYFADDIERLKTSPAYLARPKIGRPPGAKRNRRRRRQERKKGNGGREPRG
jgi:hypothetical protein